MNSFKHFCSWMFSLLSLLSFSVPSVTSECISICIDIFCCWIKITLCTKSAFVGIKNSVYFYKQSIWHISGISTDYLLCCNWNTKFILITFAICKLLSGKFARLFWALTLWLGTLQDDMTIVPSITTWIKSSQCHLSNFFLSCRQ